ncbi:hypothetical protein [Diaphorobacter aerolatus]|uniref:hypothetical protein n=1 Tax=Diaphorobacter aerolatus TaxID=1288495 RepID=UPI001D019F81|nr:hypothetical protein [Diaphorobacter aerolatus]
MSTSLDSANQPYKGNDRVLFGIILGVIAFWLFAQTTLNVARTCRPIWASSRI